MDSNPQDIKPANKRGAARLAAVQALYQLEVGECTVEATIGQFETFILGQELEDEQYLPADSDYFRHILKGVVEHQIKLDPIINDALVSGWPLTRIDATLRALLRAGTFELTQRKDIPYKVIIREYVDLAVAFFDDDVVGMVNGVLDTVAKQYSDEYPK